MSMAGRLDTLEGMRLTDTVGIPTIMAKSDSKASYR
jgi:hypothetical protein